MNYENYDRPTRYDLSHPSSLDEGATMVSHPHGDYVTHDQYCELLDAYQQAIDKLNKIEAILR